MKALSAQYPCDGLVVKLMSGYVTSRDDCYTPPMRRANHIFVWSALEVRSRVKENLKALDRGTL